MFLGVIAVTILYLTVVLNFTIDGRLDQFFMILVKGLERILSAPIDFVVIAVLRGYYTGRISETNFRDIN